MKKSISIIMPVYNAAPFLKQSIESILNQTFTDFELICINDASTDDSMKILRHYERKDKRIKLFSNTLRRGAAFSRNWGIIESEGKYLSFLDSDDLFDEDMLQSAYIAAEENQVDIIMFERKHVSSEDILVKQQIMHSDLFYERYCQRTFELKDTTPYEFLIWQVAPADKLYNRKFILSNRLEFQDLSCANDVYFVCMALMLSRRLLFLKDNRVMVYARLHDSPSRISYDRDPYCSYLALIKLAEEMRKRGLFADLCSHFYYRAFGTILGALKQCRTEEREREFYQFLRKEGIDKIQAAGKEYYNQLDNYMKNLLEQFKMQEDDSKWYRRRFGLRLVLNQKKFKEKLEKLFKDCMMQTKGIGIWGMGANGISLIEFCRENDLKIDMVVDKAKEKQGKIIEGYQIKAPEDLDEKINVIIITTRYILGDVVKELSGRRIELIDINQFFALY